MENKSEIAHQIVPYVIEWISPAYVHFKKGWKWFTIAGIIALSAILYSLYQGEYLSAIVFIILSGVYVMYYLEPPPMLHVGISELGVQISNKFYSFHQIKAFWINYLPPISTVHFKLAGKMQREIEVHLANQDPVFLRNFLVTQVPELEGKQESGVN